ncbi:MAG: nucleotidyltransferase family protein [Paracoccus sp. (in: a-proteobacteria)]|uniref:nucleotidyltransferase family protein n=1 Tax=Paracoccus sp. TaxID=267 RepID=UPI0026E0CCDB|nr:nucleotidyltransferase family protein [Paracoccus sp. (in: a-proteobacteria)]MDO5632349.1 nucleotidyltransferase family protein [Paracoccus sp. (in: a-proteobacteria)]
MPDALMIFAAGLGTRMRPLTETRPKPLIRVGGQTLLDRAIALGRAGGARRVVVNTHYLAPMIADHLAGTDVAISHEPGPVLETGGGLRQALPLLGAGAVLTLNPDVVWTGANPVAGLRAAWDGARMDALLMLVPLARATARAGGGDFAQDSAGRISRGGDLVYGGAQIINPALLDAIPETVFSLNRCWDAAIAQGRAFGLIHSGGWCDVGRPDTIPLAEALLHG